MSPTLSSDAHAPATPLAASPAATRNPVGTHVKVGKGLVAGAFADARRIGARRSRCSPGTRAAGRVLGRSRGRRLPRRVRGGRDAGVRARAVPGEPGQPHPGDVREVRATVAHNLKRAAEIGAEGVVVHTGSCVAEGGIESAMRQVREGLLPILETLDAAGETRRGCCSSRPPDRAARCAPASTTWSPTWPRSTSTRAPASASTPATFAAGAPSTSPAARPPPWTGSRSAGPAGCGWSTPTTRWTCVARSRTATRRSARATSAPARSPSCSPTRPPPASRSSSRPRAPATRTTPTCRCSRGREPAP